MKTLITAAIVLVLGIAAMNVPNATAQQATASGVARTQSPDAEQQFRRTVFNIIARNQDDHTKNIAFLMDQEGQWRLSPAFDVTYAYNPTGDWTNRHQMTLAGKREGFTRDDLLIVGREMSIKKGEDIIAEVAEAVGRWAEFAAAAKVQDERAAAIGGTHRVI